MCKGRLGSRGGGGGGRGCTSQRIHHTSDKIDQFARWCFFIVHQLYEYTCLPELNGLFPIHVNEIASTADDQNKFSLKKTKGYYMH